MGTLGKAAGVSGAFVAGQRSVIDWLLNKTRSYIFTTGAPPLLADALLTAVDLIEHGDARRSHLQALIARFKEGMSLKRWQLLPSDTPIQPVVIGDNHETLAVSHALDTEGLWVPAIRPPTVPKGAARLRIVLSAAHSEALGGSPGCRPLASGRSAGMSRDLVLLHGWGLSSSVWKPLIAQFSDTFTLHTPDLPGHSNAAPVGPNLNAWADALLARLPDEAILVGWSLGAQLALHLAQHTPERVTKLVLIGASPRFVQADDWPARAARARR